MISDWITSFSMWQTLIAASTATAVPCAADTAALLFVSTVIGKSLGT